MSILLLVQSAVEREEIRKRGEATREMFNDIWLLLTEKGGFLVIIISLVVLFGWVAISGYLRWKKRKPGPFDIKLEKPR